MKTNIVEITGGLGNQLFQYALFLSLKKSDPKSRVFISILGDGGHNGYELASDFSGLSVPVVGRIRLFVWRIVKKILNCFPAYSQKKADLIYFVPGMGGYFLGIWQRLHYVNQVENELRRSLQFIPFEDVKNQEFSNYLSITENTVALHVRRGDYLSYQDIYQPLCNTSYYQDAIRYMQDLLDHPVFVVFSNDIDWCKEHLLLKDSVFYVDWNMGENSFRDMQLISLCKHAIIANSTFSWWGAWLNTYPGKIVVTPKDWFVSCPTEAIIDVPSNWVRIF